MEAELNTDFQSKPTTIFCDNKSAIHLAATSKYLARSKHIDVRHHFIREKQELKMVIFSGLSTNDMVADNLTKPVPADKHHFCSNQMGLQF